MLSPQTKATIARFKKNKKGYYSTWIFISLILFSLIAELFINNRALIVHYKGAYYFPTYGGILPGSLFGDSYHYEANYRKLAQEFENENEGNWVLLPIIPFNAFESDLPIGEYPPTAPSITNKHFLGTDATGRDILARLVFGFRSIIGMALLFTFGTYIMGVFLGSLMGYFGGTLDLLGQRLIEIWSNIPFLYIVIIISSIIKPTKMLLLSILVLFSWTSMTYSFRSSTYREKTRGYVASARLIGASTFRILIFHILPNTIATLITFFPFTVASAITALTALDFLGFGLPPPTPSWGELLRQGTQSLSSPWIVSSATAALVGILMLTTFMGEALREAFDPKAWVYYE